MPPNMLSPPLTRLLPALLLLLFSTCTRAVQLSELIGASSTFYVSPLNIHVLSPGTALVSATSFRSYRDLQLHPIVNIPTFSLSSTTVLLAHIHPQNETVIWANAVTTLETRTFGVTVDSKNNIYVTGESPGVRKVPQPKGTIEIFKYDSSGKLVWQVSYSPPLRKDGEPLYAIADLDGGRFESALNAADSSQLVVTAKRKIRFRETPAFFVFSASTGKFLRIVDVPLPDKLDDLDPTNVVVTRTKTGPLVCYAFSGQKNVFRDAPKLYTTCTQLRKSPGVVRTKTLETLSTPDDFYHLNSADFDRSARAKSQPSLFFASEKVSRLTVRKTVNELFIRRLNSETLDEVNWATGRKKGSRRPVLISLPEPHPRFGNTHTSFQLSLKYAEKTRSVAFMFWTAINLKKFQQETKKSGRIIVSGTPRKESDPTQYWLFFIDKNRRLFPHLLKQDIGQKEDYVPETIAFSRDERLVYVLGNIRSRLVVQSVPNPVLGGKKGK